MNMRMVFFIPFSGVFILVGVLTFALTVPSTISYYYKRELLKNHSRQATATLTSISLDDSEAGLYEIVYEFQHQEENIEGSDIIDRKNIADQLELGSPLPINYLVEAPFPSSIRLRKLANMLKD